MGANATLSTTALTVEAGQEVSFSVGIRNAGTVVDQFTVDLLGEVAAFATVDPGMVNLLPGQTGSVNVRFAPPRSPDALAGSWTFGVRVASQEDPGGTTVEEGVLEIQPFTELTAEVVPAKVEGSRKANYEVAVDNRGNHPVTVALNPVDTENELDFRLQHSAVVVEPGTAAFVRLQARPKERFLRGRPVVHPFRAVCSVGGVEPVVAEAVMVQRQLLPKWLLRALIALLVVAGIITALWFTVFRPAVNSAAREAVQQQTQQMTQVAQQAKTDASQAKQDAGEVKNDVGAAKQNSERAMRAVGLDPAQPAPAGGDGGATPSPGAVLAAGDLTDFRLEANAPVTANLTDFSSRVIFTPADPKKTLVITDLILQNPRADTGTLRILRQAPNGTQTLLLEFGLANFRDLDHHWVQPIAFRPGDRVVLAVSCQNPGTVACTPAATFTGRVG